MAKPDSSLDPSSNPKPTYFRQVNVSLVHTHHILVKLGGDSVDLVPSSVFLLLSLLHGFILGNKKLNIAIKLSAEKGLMLFCF